MTQELFTQMILTSGQCSVLLKAIDESKFPALAKALRQVHLDIWTATTLAEVEKS